MLQTLTRLATGCARRNSPIVTFVLFSLCRAHTEPSDGGGARYRYWQQSLHYAHGPHPPVPSTGLSGCHGYDEMRSHYSVMGATGRRVGRHSVSSSAATTSRGLTSGRRPQISSTIQYTLCLNRDRPRTKTIFQAIRSVNIDRVLSRGYIQWMYTLSSK